MNQIKIGSFLKELRTERGLTQAELAEQLHNDGILKLTNSDQIKFASIVNF